MHRKGFLILFILIVVIVSLVNCNVLLAQKNLDSDIIKDLMDGNKKTLNIGFRSQSYPISYVNSDDASKYTGFCNIFSDELFEKLKNDLKIELKKENNLSNSQINTKIDSLKLVKSEAKNFSQGRYRKRFDGVITKKLDIECGANSINYRSNEIEFSDPFLQSGISLLTKKENIEKIALDEVRLGGLKIGIVDNTTTLDWLEGDKGYRNRIIYQSRPEAVDHLKNGTIDAYISDYIILKGIFERDKDLKDKYEVYPKYFRDQDYGIVIKKGQYKLKEIINITIKSPKVLDELKYLNTTYSKPSDKNPLPISLVKAFSNPLHSFLLGILISILALVATVKPFRQKILELALGVWERIRPDMVNWLYSLWQFLVRLILKK